MLLNEEQRMLQESARDFFTNQVPVGQLRTLRDTPPPNGYDEPTWQQIVELGWAAIPWPETYGGLAFGYKGLGVVTEESGRSLCVSPLFATVWLGGTLINLAGNDDQKSALLPPVATGEIRLALAIDESAHHDPLNTAMRATAEGGGFVLNGSKTFVLDGASADHIVVVARTSGAAGDRDGLTLFLVPADAPGLTRTPVLLADSRGCADLAFDGVRVDADGVLGQVDAGAEPLGQALDIARIGLAAEMLGALCTCFERTLEYLKEREQFDVRIGTFQALRHRAAEMYAEMEMSRSVVLEALTALDEGRDSQEIARLASLAKCQVGEAFNRISREGVQMHGGIGMTDEFDIGFFLKRSGVADATLGSSDYHRNRYGVLTGA